MLRGGWSTLGGLHPPIRHVYNVDMATNEYAAAARERKAHTLAAILRTDDLEPTDENILAVARGIAMRRPSDLTCNRVRAIIAHVAANPSTADELLDTMTPTKRRTFTAVRQNDDHSTTVLVTGLFAACRTAIADALNTDAETFHPDIATNYAAAARLVGAWSADAPTAGPNWEIIVYRFAAQIVENDS